MADPVAPSPIQKAAVVTGAARGIGFEIALRLAEAGVAVAIVDVRREDALEAAESLTAQGLIGVGLAADVSKGSEVQAAFAQVMTLWQRVDILVNNAGICPMTEVMEIGEHEWDQVLAVNLKGAFLCAQAVIPIMRSQGAGKIINIASSAGQMGGLAVGVHYSASKAGILGLTKSLARILAPEIQVNAVSPGTTESAMTQGWGEETLAAIVRQIPLRRLGQPGDVAAAVAFLASEQAAFMTGQTLSVNGGMLMP
jgi:3-oxoacyl-[acyl-carrier protein] reductase